MTILDIYVDTNKNHVIFSPTEQGSTLRLPSSYMGMAAKATRLVQEGKVDLTNLMVLSESDPTQGYQWKQGLGMMVEVSIIQDKDGVQDIVPHQNPDDGNGWIPCRGYYDRWQNKLGQAQMKQRAYCSPHLALLIAQGTQILVENSPWAEGRLAKEINFTALAPAERLNFDFRQ